MGTLRRRALLAVPAAVMLGAADSARTSAWLAAWDGQDIHRTATPGDEAGAAWLAGEARAMGANVEIERFPLDRLDPTTAFVELEGTRYPGVAMFDAPDTRDGRVWSVAGFINQGEGLIALGEYSPPAVHQPDFAAMRRESKHWALVLVTKGGAPGLALLDAEHFSQPFGPAILQVSSEYRDILFNAVGRGAALRVATRSTRTKAEAPNVVVQVKGNDPSRPPLVVMTPRSSWWVSTSERGGGLVCWLECLRAVLAASPARDVVFAANSGHELGHIGLAAFLARRPGWLTRADWVHFGANIGATGSTLTVQSATDALRARAAAALAAANQPHEVSDRMPMGETRDIHRAGGRYITLTAGNPLFHLPQDRLPHAVDPAVVTRAAAASAQLVLALSKG
jgi:hypothetical protein